MRRSRQVLAPLLASTAVALLAGCRGPEMQRCVDESNHVVDPVFCKDLPPAGRPAADVSGSHGAEWEHRHRYRTYYGGSGSYAVGSTVSDGGFVPASGHSYSTTTGTARGGFGSSFSGGEGGHGGGGGE